MSEERATYTVADGEGGDVRGDFLGLARKLVRLCNAPGEYTVELSVSPYTGKPLTYSVSKREHIVSGQVERKENDA